MNLADTNSECLAYKCSKLWKLLCVAVPLEDVPRGDAYGISQRSDLCKQNSPALRVPPLEGLVTTQTAGRAFPKDLLFLECP